MRKNNMNKTYRNIVFVGFTDEEKSKIKINDTRELKENWNIMAAHLKRFPYVLFLENMEDALRHQGFIVFIKHKDVFEEKINKKYRSLSRRYYHVIVCIEEKNLRNNLKTETIIKERLYDEKINRDLNSWYYNYLKEENRKKELEKKIKMNPKKGKIAIALKDYIGNKESFTAKEIREHFNIPLRTAQRYINYMNEIFENARYDAKTKIWMRK